MIAARHAVKPIPVVFHIGPLQVHTYGIGLALTFWFGLWYMRKRLADNGYPSEWFNGAFTWIVVAAIVGARVVHIAANLGYYQAAPIQVFEVWHGGLSSFGGLLFGVPVALWRLHKDCPQLSPVRALDLASPMLIAAWGVGRLLGPQLMVAGGGIPTTAWYGMEYAGQVGKRVPAPLFQSVESFVILAILWWIERRTQRQPAGLLLASFAALWGVQRFADEYLWLAYPGHAGAIAVEWTGLLLAAVGALAVAWLLLRSRRGPQHAGSGDPAPSGTAPTPEVAPAVLQTAQVIPGSSPVDSGPISRVPDDASPRARDSGAPGSRRADPSDGNG